MKKHWTHQLVKLGACNEAVLWCRQFDTFEEAWLSCHEGRWMWWLACGSLFGRTNSRVSNRLLSLRSGRCSTMCNWPDEYFSQLAWADAIRKAVPMPRFPR